MPESTANDRPNSDGWSGFSREWRDTFATGVYGSGTFIYPSNVTFKGVIKDQPTKLEFGICADCGKTIKLIEECGCNG